MELAQLPKTIRIPKIAAEATGALGDNDVHLTLLDEPKQSLEALACAGHPGDGIVGEHKILSDLPGMPLDEVPTELHLIIDRRVSLVLA